MKSVSLSAGERRTIMRSVMLLLPFAIYFLGVKPYRKTYADAQERLATERDALARERGAVATARRNPELQHMTDSSLKAMEPRLFEGTDDVIASSDLSAYVGEVARANHVWVQDGATRTATSTTPGVRTLHVEVRGESDLRGILSFLDALQHGDKLVRIDRLDISRGLSGAGNEQAETLTLAATISGYALGNLNVPPSPLRAAPASIGVKP
jgi:Type II secretion system (T2SS), protein M subtype b